MGTPSSIRCRAVQFWRRLQVLRFECRARAADSRGDLTGAAACARAASRLADDLPWAAALLAREALEAEDYAAALPHLLHLAPARPDEPAIQYALGVCLDYLDQPREAVAAYRQTLTLAPHWTVVLKHIGRNLYRLGETEAAECALRRFCTFQPDDREAHDLLGYLCWRQGRLRESCAHYQHAFELAPTSARLARNARLLYRRSATS